jgi:hypothetical protein
MFTNQLDKAKALYLKFKAVKLNGTKTFAEVMREDFATLRKRGFNNPHLAEIEALMN